MAQATIAWKLNLHDHLENLTFRFSNIGGSRNSLHFLSNVLTSHLGVIFLDFHFY